GEHARTRGMLLDVVFEQHVGNRNAASAAMLAKEPAIRVEQVVGRSAPQRLGHISDAAIPALDLHERAERGLVHRDDHVLQGKLLTILLVAEPDLEAKMFEDPEDERAVTHDRLELL